MVATTPLYNNSNFDRLSDSGTDERKTGSKDYTSIKVCIENLDNVDNQRNH